MKDGVLANSRWISLVSSVLAGLIKQSGIRVNWLGKLGGRDSCESSTICDNRLQQAWGVSHKVFIGAFCVEVGNMISSG